MGTYCTTTALATRMVGTTFDSITTSLATEMISDAEAEINKFLSKRYDVSVFTSLATTPPMVQMWAKRLSEAYMHQNMARGSEPAMKRADSLIANVLKNLEQVAEYKLDILDSSGDPLDDIADSGYRVLCNTSNYSPTFAEDSDVNWKVSQNKLDDISSDRDE